MEKRYKVNVKFSKILTETEFKNLERRIKEVVDLGSKEGSDILNILGSQDWCVGVDKSKVKVQHKEKNLAQYAADEILNLIRSNVEHFHYGQYTISLNKKRYKIFADNPQCVSCGIIGSIMILEKNVYETVPHFNFYAINKQGKKILMTKDHVIPQSKGGNNSYENLQTMCVDCNNLKDNSILTTEQVREIRIMTENMSQVFHGNYDKKNFISLCKFFMESKNN